MASLAWGGYANGQISPSALSSVDNFVPLAGTHSSATVLSNLLRADAARQCKLLQAAFKLHFKKNLNVSEAYRTLNTQRQYKADSAKTHVVAATPGTSIHGWALAVDFGSGVATYGTAEKVWMDANAPKYGFSPEGNTFKARGLGNNEAWHFEFILKPTITTAPASVGTTTPITASSEEDDMFAYVKSTSNSNTAGRGVIAAGRYFVIDPAAGSLRAVNSIEANAWVQGGAGRKIVNLSGNQIWELVGGSLALSRKKF